jgi:hypothetical protein
MSDSKDSGRRDFLKKSAVAVGGFVAATGTASASGRRKRKKRKRKTAKAGWVLTRKRGCKKFKKQKVKGFKVLKRRGTRKLPAGCGRKSEKKRYVCYRVKYMTKRGKMAKTTLYRRKSQPQLKVGGHYRVKKVKRCGKRCRVHFKRHRMKKKRKKA